MRILVAAIHAAAAHRSFDAKCLVQRRSGHSVAGARPHPQSVYAEEVHAATPAWSTTTSRAQSNTARPPPTRP
jgi:hypothetical protein